MLNNLVWICFFSLTLILILFDVFYLSKRKQTKNEIVFQSLFWIILGLSFSFVIYFIFKNKLTTNPNKLLPSHAMLKYLSGYLVELSLSVDNLFVILMIFTNYKIERHNQHKALFMGILGAFILRGLMIGFGISLIENIAWMTYLLGAFLLFTAIKMLVQDHKNNQEIEESKLLKWISTILPYNKNGSRSIFIEKINGKTFITPLFMALILIELTDVVFALDSIPAILAITTDSFIVYTSNILAIIGLRSLYYFLADLLEKFSLIKYSIIAILIFVSIKLLLLKVYHFNELATLLFIGISLGLGVIFSLRLDKSQMLNE